MASSSSDNFKKMFEPEHPHRKLHIAVSVLAVVAIVVYVVFTFTKVPEKVEAPPPVEDPNVALQAKIDKLLEMSASLTVQEVTPQLKAKLSEMSKLNNK